MKELPEVNASFTDLYGTLIAPIRSKLMLAGIELGVFNQLSESRTDDAVAEALKSHPEDIRMFLDGLAACDLVTKKDDTYRNTAIAQEFLVEGSPTYIGVFFAIFAQISLYAGHNDLPKLVLLDKNPQLLVGKLLRREGIPNLWMRVNCTYSRFWEKRQKARGWKVAG